VTPRRKKEGRNPQAASLFSSRDTRDSYHSAGRQAIPYTGRGYGDTFAGMSMRIRKTRAAAAIALPVALALALVGCGAGDDSVPGMDHDEMPGSASPSAESGGEFNDADAMFVTMMIPHHEQAVEMSELILAKEGIDEEVVSLAEEIKDAQQPEIEQLEDLLDDWELDDDDADTDEGEAGDDTGHADGMMSEADMDALEDADAATAQRLFLEGMIAHHEGAVDMAKAELGEGINPDALALAQTISDTQTAEIETMEKLAAGS
jgi:uncharacterized protein (DUF305 family)